MRLEPRVATLIKQLHGKREYALLWDIAKQALADAQQFHNQGALGSAGSFFLIADIAKTKAYVASAQRQWDFRKDIARSKS